MDAAAELHGDHDVTDVPSIVRGSVLLGLFEAVIVLLLSLASRLLAGPLETVVLAVLFPGNDAVVAGVGRWSSLVHRLLIRAGHRPWDRAACHSPVRSRS